MRGVNNSIKVAIILELAKIDVFLSFLSIIFEYFPYFWKFEMSIRTDTVEYNALWKKRES